MQRSRTGSCEGFMSATPTSHGKPCSGDHAESVLRVTKPPAVFAREYLSYLSDVMSRLDENAIAPLIETLLEVRQRGRHILFIGNGGSAATASHYASVIAVTSRHLLY